MLQVLLSNCLDLGSYVCYSNCGFYVYIVYKFYGRVILVPKVIWFFAFDFKLLLAGYLLGALLTDAFFNRAVHLADIKNMLILYCRQQI